MGRTLRRGWRVKVEPKNFHEQTWLELSLIAQDLLT
jgi:hypothetical protein